MSILKNGEILLFGTVGKNIVPGAEGFDAKDVIAALAQVGRSKDVTVRINSGGGSAAEGIAIFNALDSHRGKVKVVVDAVAASAASLIAMAGQETIMRSGSLMMIHDPSSITIGNSAEHRKSLEMLETIGASYADIYAERTSRPLDDIRAEMQDELWMTAREAVTKGYASRVERGRSSEPTAFDYRIYAGAPEQIVALADSRAWSLANNDEDSTEELKNTPDDFGREMRGRAAPNSEIQEHSMSEQEKAAAADEAETTVEAKVETKAEATETAEQIAARVTADVTKRNADIAAACAIAGKPDKATAFITEGKSLSDVLAALKADKPVEAEVTARNTAAMKDISASWDKQVEKVNARIRA